MMRKKIKNKILLIVFLNLFVLSSEVFANNENHNIKNFINLIKNNDCKGLSKIIRYPLDRKYPINSIKNENDFLKNCNIIFDDKLKQRIIKSDPNNKDDWEAIGWRGIMFNSGEIWFDYDGYLYVVNYESDAEKKIMEKLLLKDKENLYYTLRSYQTLIGIYETKKYLFRLDKTENDNVRYSSWKKNSKMSTKPDFVVNNCDLEYSGSGGNHSYTCKNGKYYYVIYMNNIRTKETPQVELKVLYKDDNFVELIPIYADGAKLVDY